MNRPLCSEARYCSIAAGPARADLTTSVPGEDPAPGRRLPRGTEVGKYRTDGNVGRGLVAVGKSASRGGPEASPSATALFVVPKSMPIQRGAVTLVAATRSDRAPRRAAQATSRRARRRRKAAPARQRTPRGRRVLSKGGC